MSYVLISLESSVGGKGRCGRRSKSETKQEIVSKVNI